MTDSSAWIDTRDDKKLMGLIATADKAKPWEHAPRPYFLPGMPPTAGEYWVNVIKEWADRNGLPIEYPDDYCVALQVPVSLSQLRQFMDDLYGPDTGEEWKLLKMIREDFQEDCTYLIAADEF